MRRSVARKELLKDAILIIIGGIIAFVLLKIGAIDHITDLIDNSSLSAFLAGIFFTSAFTLAPASVVLAHIANNAPVLDTAIWGASGAVCGDLILFLFIRDRFTEHLKYAFKIPGVKHFFASFHLGFMKWALPIIGALLIASPAPDEFGLAIMGMSKMRLWIFIPISFIGNIAGIYSIVWFANLL